MADPFVWHVEPKGVDGFKAHFCIKCPYTAEGVCRFSLWQRQASGNMWQWDGRITLPTISPSIDCKGGCGRHFTMVNGVPT